MTTSISITFLSASPVRQIVSNETLVLGSDSACDITFAQPNVSKRHAEIHRVGDSWWIRDLGSDNGTYLDGSIIEAAPAEHGSLLELGLGGPGLLLELG